MKHFIIFLMSMLLYSCSHKYNTTKEVELGVSFVDSSRFIQKKDGKLYLKDEYIDIPYTGEAISTLPDGHVVQHIVINGTIEGFSSTNQDEKNYAIPFAFLVKKQDGLLYIKGTPITYTGKAIDTLPDGNSVKYTINKGVIEYSTSTNKYNKGGTVSFSSLIKKQDGLFYVKDSSVPYTGKAISTLPDGHTIQHVLNNGVLEYSSPSRKDKKEYIIPFSFLVKKQNGLLYIKGTPAVYTGKAKELFPNGKTKEEGILNKGKLVGLYKEYYDNGSLKIVGKYKDGKQEGTWVLYHPNGTIATTGTLTSGVFTGVWTIYSNTGKLLQEKTYNNGVVTTTKQY